MKIKPNTNYTLPAMWKLCLIYFVFLCVCGNFFICTMMISYSYFFVIFLMLYSQWKCLTEWTERLRFLRIITGSMFLCQFEGKLLEKLQYFVVVVKSSVANVSLLFLQTGGQKRFRPMGFKPDQTRGVNCGDLHEKQCPV